MQGIKNLTHGPINRQLFNLAMPIMATSFIQMAYSLTDMAWVGRLGSEAVAAIGSVGPSVRFTQYHDCTDHFALLGRIAFHIRKSHYPDLRTRRAHHGQCYRIPADYLHRITVHIPVCRLYRYL